MLKHNAGAALVVLGLLVVAGAYMFISGVIHTQPSVPVANHSTIVYITRTGTKYHRDGCIYLRKSQILTSVAEAVAKGYEPCSQCNPPR